MKEVLREVAHEERIQHDVLGCSDCFVDPHNGHMSYCPLSVYNLFHPSHMCLAGAPCQEHGIFQTLSLLFFRLFVSPYPSTLFSLSFTLQRKDKTHAIDLMM